LHLDRSGDRATANICGHFPLRVPPSPPRYADIGSACSATAQALRFGERPPGLAHLDYTYQLVTRFMQSTSGARRGNRLLTTPIKDPAMKNNKFFGKKSALYALVAATATLGLASVNTTAQAAGSIGTAMKTVSLKVNNNTNGCVRAYSMGQQFDIAPHSSRNIPAAYPSGYMASVFKYGCGGQALGNRWYTTNDATFQTWNIY
jgi:hypothetical protein